MFSTSRSVISVSNFSGTPQLCKSHVSGYTQVQNILKCYTKLVCFMTCSQELKMDMLFFFFGKNESLEQKQ